MDVSLESKSLPSVGNSIKSYLKVTSQRLARGKLVHLHGWRLLALPSVGLAKGYSRRAAKLAFILRFSASNLLHISGNFRRKSTTLYKKAAKSLRNKRILFTSSPCIPDLLMAKDFKASVLHVSELPIALPKIPYNSPQSRIALEFNPNTNLIEVDLLPSAVPTTASEDTHAHVDRLKHY
ncbi:hypothetical protein CK203_044706 [Vitis vinifera]|uniref:Uncharacterized protein n=1 Tax=Vitis vinifera TaxID=29760 RepID=A0A438H9G0_VITVI|nr:hypothetical protein CK203_044706 [Vitis vinifera]